MKSFNKVIAAMANRKNDGSIAAYLNFLASKFPILEILNFHVFTTKSIYDQLNKHAPRQGDELLARIENRLNQNSKDIYTSIPKVSNHVRLGDPFKAMISETKETGADFVALGKLKNTHGTMAKNMIRYAESNIMVIPEETRHSLTHILVPVDLSGHSGKILKAAIDIQKVAGNEIKITCLHAYQALDLTYYFLDKPGNTFQDANWAKAEAEFDRFIVEHAGKDTTNIEKVLIREVIHRPSQSILSYIDENDVDLVIMGAKSHSAFDAFLGSTAEKVISKNDKVPLLVIK